MAVEVLGGPQKGVTAFFAFPGLSWKLEEIDNT